MDRGRKLDVVGKLPVEMSQRILSYLSAEDLAAASAVSRTWRERTDSDSLWRPICSREEFLPSDQEDPRLLDEGGCFWRRVYSCLRRGLLENWRASRHRRFLVRLRHREPVWSCSDDALVLGFSAGEVEVYGLGATPRHVATLSAPLDAPVTALTHNKEYVVVQQADFLFFYSRRNYAVVSSCVVRESSFSAEFFEADEAGDLDSEDCLYADFIGAGDDTLFVLVPPGLVRISLKGGKPRELSVLHVPPERDVYVDDNSLYLFEENDFLTVLNDRGSKSILLRLWAELVPYKILSNDSLVLVLCTLADSHAMRGYDATTGEAVYTRYTSRPYGVGLHPGRREAVVYTRGDGRSVAEEPRTEAELWSSDSLFRVDGLAGIQFSFVRGGGGLLVALTRADWHVYDLAHVVDFKNGTLLYRLEVEALRLLHANDRMIVFFSPEGRVEVLTFR